MVELSTGTSRDPEIPRSVTVSHSSAKRALNWGKRRPACAMTNASADHSDLSEALMNSKILRCAEFGALFNCSTSNWKPWKCQKLRARIITNRTRALCTRSRVFRGVLEDILSHKFIPQGSGGSGIGNKVVAVEVVSRWSCMDFRRSCAKGVRDFSTICGSMEHHLEKVISIAGLVSGAMCFVMSPEGLASGAWAPIVAPGGILYFASFPPCPSCKVKSRLPPLSVDGGIWLSALGTSPLRPRGPELSLLLLSPSSWYEGLRAP